MHGLLLVTLFWAFSFSLMRTELAGIPYPAIVAIRISLAILVFACFFRYKIPLKLIPRLLALGAIMVGVMYLTLTASLKVLQAHQVALLTIFTPFYVALLEDIRERRLRPAWWLPAILSVIGAGVIQYQEAPAQMNELSNSLFFFSGNLVGGIILIQLSNLSFAVGQVYFRHLVFRYKPKSELHWMPWIFTGALLFSTPFWLSESMGWGKPFAETFWAQITLRQSLVLLFLGTVSSGACIYMWNHYGTRVSGPVLAVFNNLLPPVAALVSLYFFGETTDMLRLGIGLTLIMIGLFWGMRITRSPKTHQE